MISYQMTHLEERIQGLYESIGISKPHQLNIIDIAASLNIWVYFKPFRSQAIEMKGLYSINIDRRLSPAEQWEDFGHELGHVVRDYGNQLNMERWRIDHQEMKAANFALEFCIPTFMLKRFKLPDHKTETIEFITDTFHVTPKFAEKKLYKLLNNSTQSKMDREHPEVKQYEKFMMKKFNADYIQRIDDQVYFYRHDGKLCGILYLYEHLEGWK